MKDFMTHVKQDEWRYTTSNSKSRKKAKRARNKAKRSLINKILKQNYEDL